MHVKPSVFLVIRCLVVDSFRQAFATRMFWLMLAVTLICTLLCASVQVTDDPRLRSQHPSEFELLDRYGDPLTGPNHEPGRVTIGFGAISLPLFRDGRSQIHHLQSLMAIWVVGGVGTLFCLIWTAGFFPDFLQPASISVLLARPVSRSTLLIGKYCGVVCLVGMHTGLFVLATWVALGLATGTWNPGYWVTLPLFVVLFAAIYSISVLFATLTTHTGATLFASILFWLVALGMNQAYLNLQQFDEIANALPFSQVTGIDRVVEFGYLLLPKPHDTIEVLDSALEIRDHFHVLNPGGSHPSVDSWQLGQLLLTHVVFLLVILWMATRQFGRHDY